MAENSDVKQRINDDMKQAMKAREKIRLGTIRLAMAAIKQIEIDERISLDDNRVFAVLNKMIKQRHESITHYEAAGRMELAKIEADEITVLKTYLPPPVSEAKVDLMIQQVIAELNASSIKDMGKVMAAVKKQVQGTVDMKLVSEKVKEQLIK